MNGFAAIVAFRSARAFWGRVRTRARHLLALATSKRQAILAAMSRKAYRHLSRTLVTQTAMTNRRLEHHGLLSIVSGA